MGNVVAMSILRYFFGVANLVVATLMWRWGRADSALRLNAILGAIGPFVFLIVSLLGIAGLAGKVSPVKLGLTLAGVVLMFLGTR